jgi:hypothetical protein
MHQQQKRVIPKTQTVILRNCATVRQAQRVFQSVLIPAGDVKPRATGAAFWARLAKCWVDPARIQAHDGLVDTATPSPAARRSTRVFTRIPVRAAGKSAIGRKFRENSQTIVVNAHGALLYVQAELEMGADITLINPVTEEEQDCRVVFLGDLSEKGQRIGVEFLSPAPHFWGVDFTPTDWPGRAPGAPVR